jgi:aminopeptidase N
VSHFSEIEYGEDLYY